MLQNKLFRNGSFAAKSISVMSLATAHGIEDLNQLSGLELMSIISIPGYAVLFLQSSDIKWEYISHVDTRYVGMKGFLGHDHRRETICADLEKRVEDGWRIVSVLEGSSGILIFLFKRPVQEQSTEDDS